LLTRQAGVAHDAAEVRRTNALRWRNDLPPSIAAGVPPVVEGGIGGYLRFPVRVAAAFAARVDSAALRRLGMARSYPTPLGALPPIAARLRPRHRPMPGAEALARELVTLPTHDRLTEPGRAEILATMLSWSPSSA
jgi:dTDP-4-amino-4,6-dideoxygalactose transaminase